MTFTHCLEGIRTRYYETLCRYCKALYLCAGLLRKGRDKMLLAPTSNRAALQNKSIGRAGGVSTVLTRRLRRARLCTSTLIWPRFHSTAFHTTVKANAYGLLPAGRMRPVCPAGFLRHLGCRCDKAGYPITDRLLPAEEIGNG